MAANTKHGLGRGLGALFGDEELVLDGDVFVSADSTGIKTVKLSDLQAGKFQPRKSFDAEAISALAESIKEKGVLQPILVRKRGDKYEIIAGERRFRAAGLAGLTEIPVIEKDFADNEALEVALVENIVRKDLSALEEASGLSQLMADFSYTQERLSAVVGKSRSYIANSLRLLTLPDAVKQLLEEEKLSAGHARTLIGLDNAQEIALAIVQDGLSVRQTEELVSSLKKPISLVNKKPSTLKDEELLNIEKDLTEKLGLKVQIISGKNGKGRVTLTYNDFSELENIIEKLEQ